MIRLAVVQDAAAGTWPERLARLDVALARLDAVDLVLCPELFTTGYGPPAALLAFDEAADRATEADIAARARRLGAGFAYGTIEPAGDRRFNVARLLDRSGRRLATQRKMALPPQSWEAVFTTGTQLSVVDWEGWRLGLLVCFDIEFPENARGLAERGAELLLVPTALGRACPIVARRVVPVRAFENGVFVAYANYAGPHGGTTYLGESVIAGPDGAELARAGAVPTCLTATLDRPAIAAARARLPFLELAPRRPR